MFTELRSGLAQDRDSRATLARRERQITDLRVADLYSVDAALEGNLNYSKSDDRLIGILSTLDKSGVTNYKLFTNDTGPASTAARNG